MINTNTTQITCLIQELNKPMSMPKFILLADVLEFCRRISVLALVFICMPVIADAQMNEGKQEHNAEVRALQAFKVRTDAALQNLLAPSPKHPVNDDETELSSYINSYTKGLPHDELGIVDSSAYQLYLAALKSGESVDFEKIPTGIKDGKGLRNPLAAFSFLMEGKDPHSFTMSAAPSFSSMWQAAEAGEVMWKAILRDVSFSDYSNNELVAEAVDDLNKLSDFRGPKIINKITEQTLFRGAGISETKGPYISQFLLLSIPFGATRVEQLYNVPVPGNDHLINYKEWVHIQNGWQPTGITIVNYETEPRYLYIG